MAVRDAIADLPPELAVEFVRQAPFLPGDVAVSLAADSSAVTPWPHQIAVARKAVARYPQGFLFCDEVGLGKTVEAGLALRSLWISRRVRRALLLVPAALLRQWHEELHEKFALPVARFDGEGFVDFRGRDLPTQGDDPWNRQGLILASSQLARRRERRRQLLDAEPWDLVLVDEAHHARRRDPASEGYRPNRLLELLAGRTARDENEVGDDCPSAGSRRGMGLVHRSRCVWLLTATPMQIHPAELWDLLGLVSAPVPADDDVNEDSSWRDQVFRHTRKVLRRYRRDGLLDAEVPTRRPENVWIELGEEARAVYRRIEQYLSLFYRRYEAERRGLGFVMTVYRRRLTSSFEAIRRSLVRRRKRLASGEPAAAAERERQDAWGLDADPESENSARGLFDAASGADELAHLEGFLGDLARLGVDPKVEQLRADLRRLLAERDRALVFTQYLDTLDHLRDVLAGEWTVACWSGRGGEVREGDDWVERGKEELKAAFGAGDVQVLLATDAASEGLNLQSCGVLINFDLPWNPMRVEQRIGRIDRIGQRHPEVWIRSYFYADTVEAEVYRRLADRIRWFEDVVGALQPILQQVGQAVGEVAMLPPDRRQRPLEERLQALERGVEEADAAPSVDLEDDFDDAIDLRVELSETKMPVVSAEVEHTVLTAARNILQPTESPGIYRIHSEGPSEGRTHRVTFQPDIYDAHPYSTRLLTWGDPLFDRLLDDLLDSQPVDDSWSLGGAARWSDDTPGGVGVYRSERPAPVTLFLHPGGEARTLHELARLASSAPATWRPDGEAEASSRFSTLRRRALRVRESIEAERRRSERTELHRTAQRLLVRLALLELVEAENPGLFDRPLPWSFGVRAVREQARHGEPLDELVARLDGKMPPALADDPFYVEARRHRRGWRERRRRMLMAQADNCLLRLRGLGAAEAEARRRMDEPSAGMLDRRWFRTTPQAEAGPQLLAAVNVEPFVSAVPALGDFRQASRRLLDAAEEGWDLLAEIRRDPEPESWLRVEGRAGGRRFAARALDDAMSSRAAEGDWCLLESNLVGSTAARVPTDGELLLVRASGKTMLRRLRRRGSVLVLEADTPGRTVVVEDPDPESVQVVGRFVGRV